MTQPEPERPPPAQIIPLIADGILAADDWAWTFLASYTGQDAQSNLGNISKAHRKAGVSRSVYETRRQNDHTFRALCDQAHQALIDALYERLYNHAMLGQERPVTARGEIIAYVTEMDGPSMRWLLERLDPERFHLPTVVEHVAPGTAGAFTFQLGEEPLLIEQGEVTE